MPAYGGPYHAAGPLAPEIPDRVSDEIPIGRTIGDLITKVREKVPEDKRWVKVVTHLIAAGANAQEIEHETNT